MKTDIMKTDIMKTQIMKKIVLVVLFTVALVSCSSDDNTQPQPQVNENTIVGRWHLVGFETLVIYEFTNDLRYTIYSTDGVFGDVSSAIPLPNSYILEDGNLTIDLNFGNFSVSTPVFKCNGNVVDLVSEHGTGTMYREGYNYSDCDE